MISGIGTDIIEIKRVERLLSRYGTRFSKRILTSSEHQKFATHPHPANFIAMRFAAKEACVKALGTGFRDGIGYVQINITNDELGKPQLQYSGKVAKLISARSIKQSHISLSDERKYAIAFVVLET